MRPVIFVETPSVFHAMIDALAGSRHVAVDTESNSFYAYFERICLIQLSIPDQDFIVDPFALPDLSPLGEILQDSSIEKILHAASNDVLGIKRDYRFRIRNLFDTAIACKILGYTRLGLARILEEHFGVVLNKRYQRHDWRRRPLTQEQMDYARMDTHFLLPLRHKLAADLEARGLLDQAREAFTAAEDQEAATKKFRPGSYIQIRGARALDPAGKKVLQALYLFREHEAKRTDRAPFRIMSNETLMRLAIRRPKNLKEFSQVKGLPRMFHQAGRGTHILELIRKNEPVLEDVKAGE